jgi:hypothetical protein
MVDSATQMLEDSKGLRRLLGAAGVSCGVERKGWQFRKLSGRITYLWGRFLKV